MVGEALRAPAPAPVPLHFPPHPRALTQAEGEPLSFWVKFSQEGSCSPIDSRPPPPPRWKRKPRLGHLAHAR